MSYAYVFAQLLHVTLVIAVLIIHSSGNALQLCLPLISEENKFALIMNQTMITRGYSGQKHIHGKRIFTSPPSIILPVFLGVVF